MVASFWASVTAPLQAAPARRSLRAPSSRAAFLGGALLHVGCVLAAAEVRDGGIPALHEAPPLSHARMSVSLTSHAFAYASSAFHNFRLAPLVPGCA